MSLWLILAAMTLLALGLLLWPLLRRHEASFARRNYELSVYRAQLEELERERARGLLGPAEAEAARLEVQRRMLVADAEREDRAARPASSRRRIALAAALVLGLPLMSGAIYLQLGSPDLPDQPLAARLEERREPAQTAGGGTDLAAVESMIARLEERVQKNPDDVEGWLRLARAFELTEAPARAAGAYREAVRLRPEIAAIHAALAEALVLAADGVVTEEARSAIERALELDPSDFRARFYRGLALAQRGERQDALDVWTALIADSPADAPWLEGLRQRAAGLAEELGLDPQKALPEPQAPAVAAAEGGDLPGDEAGLRAEVDRLAQALTRNPKDWQGWLRLARAHVALGEPEVAEQVLAAGSNVYAQAPFVQQQFAAAAIELGLEPPAGAGGAGGPTQDQVRTAAEMNPAAREEMIRGMVANLARRLEEEPDDPEGWRMLARSYDVLGQPEQAAQATKRLAGLLPQDPAAQLDHARALLALGEAGAPIAPAAIAQLERVIALDRDNPEALFFLGQAAAEKGANEQARDYWRRLLAALPADAPERAQVKELIDRLDS